MTLTQLVFRLLWMHAYDERAIFQPMIYDIMYQRRQAHTNFEHAFGNSKRNEKYHFITSVHPYA